MDEITMFRTLRPEPPADADVMLSAARGRLAAAAGAPAPRESWPRWRLPAAGGIVAAVASAAVAASMVVSAGPPGVRPSHTGTGTVVTAAWVVHKDPSGSVTVWIRQLTDPSGLQRALEAGGVRAFVRGIVEQYQTVDGVTYAYSPCGYRLGNREPYAVQHGAVTADRKMVTFRGATFPALLAFTIHPAAMPLRSTLVIVEVLTRTRNGTYSLGAGIMQPYVVAETVRNAVCVRTPFIPPSSPPSLPASPSPSPAS
jgi:hypothetical protein